MTTTLQASYEQYAAALLEVDVDPRVFNYVSALMNELRFQQSIAYDLQCKLEDAEQLIHDLHRGAAEND
jgi:predicted methyltransferase